MSTEEEDEAKPHRWLHHFARYVVVPVLTVVTVNHLLEGAFHRLRELPGDLPEVIAHPIVGIAIEIVVSAILTVLVQYSLATIMRAGIVTSIAILGYLIAGAAETPTWQDAIVIGGGFGFLFFTPMLELPYEYVMYRDRLAREKQEIEDDNRYAWLPTVALPASWLDGTWLGLLYALTLAVYVPVFIGLTVYYLQIPPIRAAVTAVLIPAVLCVIGIGLASTWVKIVEARDRDELRQRQARFWETRSPPVPDAPERPLEPEAAFAEHKKTYDAFVRGVKLATAAIALTLIGLALFLL